MLEGQLRGIVTPATHPSGRGVQQHGARQTDPSRCGRQRRLDIKASSLGAVDPSTAAEWLSVAALSSVATAATLLSSRLGTARAENEQTSQAKGSSEARRTEDTPSPTTVAEIWDVAWLPFKEQQPPPEGQSPSLSADEPISRPLLWLQGLRAGARRELLELSLSILQRRIAALPSDAATVMDGAAWSPLTKQLLVSCSAEVAESWLGYQPAALQDAVTSHLSQLQADRIACKNAAPAVLSGNDDNSEGNEPGREVTWYGLAERLPLYCSVLRLLRSADGLRPIDAAGGSEPPPGIASMAPAREVLHPQGLAVTGAGASPR